MSYTVELAGFVAILQSHEQFIPVSNIFCTMIVKKFGTYHSDFRIMLDNIVNLKKKRITFCFLLG